MVTDPLQMPYRLQLEAKIARGCCKKEKPSWRILQHLFGSEIRIRKTSRLPSSVRKRDLQPSLFL